MILYKDKVSTTKLVIHNNKYIYNYYHNNNYLFSSSYKPINNVELGFIILDTFAAKLNGKETIYTNIFL